MSDFSTYTQNGRAGEDLPNNKIAVFQDFADNGDIKALEPADFASATVYGILATDSVEDTDPDVVFVTWGQASATLGAAANAGDLLTAQVGTSRLIPATLGQPVVARLLPSQEGAAVRTSYQDGDEVPVFVLAITGQLAP